MKFKTKTNINAFLNHQNKRTLQNLTRDIIGTYWRWCNQSENNIPSRMHGFATNVEQDKVYMNIGICYLLNGVTKNSLTIRLNSIKGLFLTTSEPEFYERALLTSLEEHLGSQGYKKAINLLLACSRLQRGNIAGFVDAMGYSQQTFLGYPIIQYNLKICDPEKHLDKHFVQLNNLYHKKITELQEH